MPMMLINVFNVLQQLNQIVKKLEKNSQRISKIKPFINKSNWKGLGYAPGKDDWKKFEESN